MLPTLSKVKDIQLIGVVSGKGLSAQNAAQRYKFRYATSDESQVLNDPLEIQLRSSPVIIYTLNR